MANFVFNISKGRVAELYNRVKSGDPAAARLYVIPVDVGTVTDATLTDQADFGAVITAGVTERTTNGWNRKTLAAARNKFRSTSQETDENRQVSDL